MKRHISILLSFLFLFLFNISFALTEKDFEHSMNFYQKLVEKKVSVEELVFTLKKILKKYDNIEINLAPVREKLLTLGEFKVSRAFYKKLEAKKVSVDERIAALERILTKFRNSDVDLSGMEKELKRLQEAKVGKGEELEKVEEFKVEEEIAAPTIEEDFGESKLEEEKVEEPEEGKVSGSEIEEEVEEVKDLEDFEEFRP